MRRLLAAALIVGALGLLGFGVLNSGAVRHAGFPLDLAVLEGTWVLDHTKGAFPRSAPDVIRFTEGTSPGRIRMTDETREAEFHIEGLGRLVFASGAEFSPLLPSGQTDGHAMTHLCPPMPQWDHLSFFPDGAPIGRDADRRFIRYERE